MATRRPPAIAITTQKNMKKVPRLLKGTIKSEPPAFSRHVEEASNNNTNKNDAQRCAERFQSVVNLLRGKKNILVLAGAGISVSCGIPDFRSKGTGLYSTLDAQSLGLASPEDLFDLEVFTADPRPFYKFAKVLYRATNNLPPSTSHKFLALLEEKKMLLRVYTQNIDGLEEAAGVSPQRVVYAHGSLQRKAQCMECRAKVNIHEIREDIMAGRVPRCNLPSSKKRNATTSLMNNSLCDPIHGQSSSRGRGPKRIRRSKVMASGVIYEDSSSTTTSSNVQNNAHTIVKSDNVCGGVIKPGVTFFGERLSDRVGKCLEADHQRADALVVIGTSLSVAPMSRVIQYLPKRIPRLLINRTIVRPPLTTNATVDDEPEEDTGDMEEEYDLRDNHKCTFDACLLGYCDDVTQSLAKALQEKDTNNNNNNRKNNNNNDDEQPLFLDCSNQRPVFCSSVASEKDLHEYSADRIFLFPGAILDSSSTSRSIFIEIAHCNVCRIEVRGTIMKCSKCFDYDLCVNCHESSIETHFGGTHSFVSEQSATV